MKSTKKIIAIILAAFGFICIGVAYYFDAFENDKKEIIADEQNASVAVVHNAIYDKNTAVSISSYNSKCLDYGEGCKITLPEIVVSEKLDVVGWSSDKDGQNEIYKPNSEITIDSDITLYAIAKEKQELKRLDGIEYCNNDLKCSSNVDVVKYACSQVGYTEKKDDNDKSSCSANAGTENYQKYGNNGNVWDASFVAWVFKSAKASLQTHGIGDVNDVSSYVEWAKNYNKYFTNKNSLHDGDLVLTNDNQRIGIAIKNNNVWYMIAGNYNDKVSLVVAENISGFISMRGIAY